MDSDEAVEQPGNQIYVLREVHDQNERIDTQCSSTSEDSAEWSISGSNKLRSEQSCGRCEDKFAGLGCWQVQKWFRLLHVDLEGRRRDGLL